MLPTRRLLPLLAAVSWPALLQAQQAAPPPAVPVEAVTVIATSPLLGVGIDRDLVPGETTVLGSADLAREGTPNLTQALSEQVGGIELSSASGNPYQPDLYYHGFVASPLQGNSQGLAVYMNGVRFNQPFGDTVNWDLIPDIAISKLNVEGSNPVFGLNALGGSINVNLKNGFTYQGAQADVSGGSFGQVQGEFQYGAQSGTTSFYAAGSELHQGGWRDLQSSDIQNFYSDFGWRGDQAEVHLGVSMANSVLNGPGTSPVQLLAADPAAQFTAPNAVDNRSIGATLSGSYAVSDEWSIQTVGYYEYLLQRVQNGNSPNDFPCDDGSGLLCSSPGVYSTTRGGGTIPDFLHGGPYSELDTQTTNTNGYGVSLQATDTGDLFGLANHFVAGGSFDGAQTIFSGDATIGGLTPGTRIFVGPGVLIDEPGINVPVRVSISDAYYALFASDTVALTPRLALTVSGRFNNAEVDLVDQNGGDLTGQHRYDRFNPAAGLTYKVTPWLTAYAGYSEANRAPTPAELSCAGPNESCSLANFFTGDPNLKQVVARTEEAGIRGALNATADLRVSYNVNLFRTNSDDDIEFINSVTLNRAYFQNIGTTRRQGFDAQVNLKDGPWRAYAAFSYTDATFQSGFVESAGSNPQGDANGNLTIRPGDRLPGVPASQAKFGASYQVSEPWSAGFSGVYQSGQYLSGDDANLNARLPSFVTVNIHSSYQITPHIEVFGRIENLTDARYYTYGTFSPTSAVFLSQAPGATNPRSYSLAAPIGGFGGVRVTF
jgi:outer membrane receptor protein involved in Fe transport